MIGKEFKIDGYIFHPSGENIDFEDIYDNFIKFVETKGLYFAGMTSENLEKIMKIKITKLKEVDNPTHPNNIEEGYSTIRETSDNFFNEPEVGNHFWVGNFRTSIVQEIIDEKTFKTLNSIYEWEIIKD